MTSWVRLWHDMPTDPKWRTIARKSGQRVGDVIAVFNFLLCNASCNAMKRGTLEGFDNEDVATALDLSESDVAAIIQAMQGKVLDGDRLTGWDARQPKREENSTGRVRAWREKQRAEVNAGERVETQCNAVKRNVTQRNAPDTDTDTDTDIPLAKANDAAASDKLFWDNAVNYLGGNPKRALIGKWIKQYGKEQAGKAITAAQLERAVDPVAYIERTLRGAKVEREVKIGI